MEIRHLKERMLRKCARLAKAWTAPRHLSSTHTSGIASGFMSIPAPESFRLKELERWMRHEDLRRSGKLPASVPRRMSTASLKGQALGSACCERCAHLGAHVHKESQTPSEAIRSSSSLNRNSMSHRKHKSPSPTRIATTNNDEFILGDVDPALTDLNRNAVSVAGITDHLMSSRLSNSSPEPLPVPYRPRPDRNMKELLEDILGDPSVTIPPQDTAIVPIDHWSVVLPG